MDEMKVLSRGKSGWTNAEQECLWQEVRLAGEQGTPLRDVFESVARKTGRKPNSIRNYYYLSIKSGSAPQELDCQRAMPFVPFTQDELHHLVREVLKARTDGESVRACVMRLGQGDRAKTLRYQNKYRSILKSRPDYIRQVMAELGEEGVQFDELFTPVRRKRSLASYGQPAEEYVSRILSYGKQGELLLQSLCEFLDAAAQKPTSLHLAPRHADQELSDLA